jgi:PAS domain S-box-containing protein
MQQRRNQTEAAPARDSTLRHSAAIDLRRYKAIIDSTDDAIIAKTLQGIITSWNPGAERMFGYSAEETIGHPLSMLIPADRLTEETEIMRRVAGGEMVNHFETVRRCKDARLIDVSVTISPIHDEFGSVVGASKIARDITERKTVTADLCRFKAIIDSSDDAIISNSLLGVVTSWNRGAEKMFGYTAQEAIGHSISMLIPFDRKQEEEEIFVRIARGDPVEHFETVRRGKDGALIDISATTSPIRDGAGTVIGASTIARDITERQRNRDHVQLLLPEVNHRAKNLLAVVRAVVVQTFRLGDPATIRDRLCDRIGGLAAGQDLLVNKAWQGVELSDLILAQLDLFKEQIGTRVLLDGPSAQLTPAASQGIGMALHELATNAAKYGAMANGQGRIRISWEVSAAPNAVFLMSWQEEGGPKIAASVGKGFGQTVLGRMVEHAIEGTAHSNFAEGGLLWRLSAPAENVLAATAQGL